MEDTEKKLLCILVALLLCMGNFAVAQSDDLTGTWYAKSMSDGTVEYAMADIGRDMSMTLNADGTTVVTATDEEDQVGTWERTETGLKWIGDNINLNIIVNEDGTLLAEEKGTTILFSREAPQSFIPGEPITAESIAAFAGNWKGIKVSIGGSAMSSSLLFAELSLSVEGETINGTFAYVSPEYGTDSTFSSTGTFADGVVTLVGENMDGSLIKMYDSGLLALQSPETYGAIIFYFEPVVTE